MLQLDRGPDCNGGDWILGVLEVRGGRGTVNTAYLQVSVQASSTLTERRSHQPLQSNSILHTVCPRITSLFLPVILIDADALVHLYLIISPQSMLP